MYKPSSPQSVSEAAPGGRRAGLGGLGGSPPGPGTVAAPVAACSDGLGDPEWVEGGGDGLSRSLDDAGPTGFRGLGGAGGATRPPAPARGGAPAVLDAALLVVGSGRARGGLSFCGGGAGGAGLVGESAVGPAPAPGFGWSAVVNGGVRCGLGGRGGAGGSDAFSAWPFTAAAAAACACAALEAARARPLLSLRAGGVSGSGLGGRVASTAALPSALSSIALGGATLASAFIRRIYVVRDVNEACQRG